MKKIVLSVSVGTWALLLTACGQSTPSVKDNSNKCATIERDLLKVERYTQKVESMSAFHLQEYANAIYVPNISTSNNKPQMLRDAAKRKGKLEAEYKALSCPVKK